MAISSTENQHQTSLKFLSRLRSKDEKIFHQPNDAIFHIFFFIPWKFIKKFFIMIFSTGALYISPIFSMFHEKIFVDMSHDVHQC